MTRTLSLLVACGLALAGCGGGSPTAATPATVNLAGAWTGTWSYVSAGVTVTDTVTLTLTAGGSSFSGIWSSAGGPGGTVVLTPATQLTGTSTISQTLLNGVNCSATTTLSGTASASQIRYTLVTPTPTGLCQWATNQQFLFTR